LLARSPYLAGLLMRMQGQMHVHLMRADALVAGLQPAFILTPPEFVTAYI
jgi:hypothetical protein